MYIEESFGGQCLNLWDSSIPYHWTDGGTGVANFMKKKRRFYEKTISIYGDTTIFVGPPIHPLHNSHDYLALHHINRKDLSAFWRIYNAIAYSLEKHPWMFDQKNIDEFNLAQMKKHGFSRIN